MPKILNGALLILVPLISGFWTLRTWQADRQPPVPVITQQVVCHPLPDQSWYFRVAVTIKQTGTGTDTRLYCLERQVLRDVGATPYTSHLGTVDPIVWGVVNDGMPRCESKDLTFALDTDEQVILSRWYRLASTVKRLEVYSSVSRSATLATWQKEQEGSGWDMISTVDLSKDCTR
jgi:hypothetical protein